MGEWIVNLAFMAAALALLFAGAEGLVKGSAALALRAGLSPLVVSLMIEAFGIRSPELVVNVKKDFWQQGDTAVGYPDGRQHRAQDGITGRLSLSNVLTLLKVYIYVLTQLFLAIRS